MVNLRHGLANSGSLAALVGGPSVSEDGDSHANVARGNGSDGTNEEGDGSVREVGRVGGLLDLSSIDGEADDQSEDTAEEGKVDVFSLQELFGTISDETIDLNELVRDVLGFLFIANCGSFFVVVLLLLSEHLLDGLEVLEIDLVYDEEVDQPPSDGGDRNCHNEIDSPVHGEYIVGVETGTVGVSSSTDKFCE